MGRMSYGEMKFGDKLQKLIDDRGPSQSALARKTGIAQSAISEMANGKRRAYMDQSLLLAKSLGVSLDYLADDELDEMPPVFMTERRRRIWDLVELVGEEEALRRLAKVEATSTPLHHIAEPIPSQEQPPRYSGGPGYAAQDQGGPKKPRNKNVG